MPRSYNSDFIASGQGGGTDYEPMRKAHYEVDIQGLNSILVAQDCNLPKIELDEVKVPYGNDNIKIIGTPNVSDFRVMLLDVVTPDVVGNLWKWFKQGYDPNTGRMFYSNKYKRIAMVYLYDIEGVLTRTWTCKGVWLKGSPTPDEAYQQANHDIVKIDCTMAVDRATLDYQSNGTGAGTPAS